MDPSYPEALVVAADADIDALATADIPPFITSASDATFSVCAAPAQTLSDATIAFLGAATGTRCLTSVRHDNTVEFYGDEQQKQHLGTLTLNAGSLAPDGYATNWENPMRLWLGPEQQVTSRPPADGVRPSLRVADRQPPQDRPLSWRL